jgi:predicted Rossmann fold flavoprotein
MWPGTGAALPSSVLTSDRPSNDAAAACDLAVVGAGAAGLMAAIWAARTLHERGPDSRVVALDGAAHLGAKILVAGGGRCNVTHDHVDEAAFAGSSPHAIKKVLRAFDVERTIAFFRSLGVELKREETGKLFPTTDRARTVLNALLNAAATAGAQIRNPRRVTGVERRDDRFRVSGEWGTLEAHRLILATGGMALPKSGSDGAGYAFARALGHTVTDRVFPALVPLVVEPPHFIRDLSGVTLPATIEVRAGSGKKLASFTDSTLLTHFGLSGPSVLDASRHYTAARFGDPGAHVVVNFLPGATFESLDRDLAALGARPPRPIGSFLRERLPERLAAAVLAFAGVPPETTGATLTKDARRALVRAVVEHRPPITGDRGFTHAEVTAGGVPLAEVHLDTMESRVCPGLHLCGEILDVDGRIGGYNFQWAWSSGYLAGIGAARALGQAPA